MFERSEQFFHHRAYILDPEHFRFTELEDPYE